MSTIALIQARMSSSRFPGKVVADLAGKPMIAFMVDRVRRAKSLDGVIVVTSTDTSDDGLVGALDAAGIASFRGALNDVLRRFADATPYGADVLVRLTGDCPLVDPAVIDAVVALRAATGVDYASNVDPPTFADGLDVECFTRASLELADRTATETADREHVTLWMRSNASGLKRANLAGAIDSSHLRLTVDYPEDLTIVRRLVELIGEPFDRFDQFDMLRCIAAYPELFPDGRPARNEALLTPNERS